MGQLDNRTALITGGGTGIGFSIARRFHAEGAAVLICGRREEVVADAARKISPRGERVLAVQADINSEAEVAALVCPGPGVAGQAGHPGEQRRSDAHQQAARGNLAGGVAVGHRHQHHRDLPLLPRSRQTHDPAEARLDRQHRLHVGHGGEPLLPRRLLRGLQVRPAHADQGPGGGVGSLPHQRQRGGARLLRHAAQPRLLRRAPGAVRQGAGPDPAALPGGHRATEPAWSSPWSRTPPPT